MLVSFLYLLLFIILFFFFELIDRKSEKPIVSFLDKKHTLVLKGIAILFVVLGHIGTKNNFRFFAPLGGMGVSIFLICFGFGLNESSKKNFSAKTFVIKRVLTVMIPYILTRLVAAIVFGIGSVKTFILDLLCIFPQYELGWFIPYILFWYIVFFIIKVLKRFTERFEIAILFAVSVVLFFVSGASTRSQQVFMFPLGVLLSRIGAEKRNSIAKKAFVILLISFVIGLCAALINEIHPLEENSYLLWFVYMLYKNGWAISTICIIWLLHKIFSMRFFSLLGIISYELYLIHGYFFPIINKFTMIIPFVAVNVAISILLHYAMKMIKKVVKA